MKIKGEIAKKGLYIGTGVGLVLFALIGLLPGSFIGGVVGLGLAGSIFGTPIGAQLLPRIIVGAFMMLGVVVAGLIFIIGSSLLGWIIGYVIDAIKVGGLEAMDLAAHHKK